MLRKAAAGLVRQQDARFVFRPRYGRREWERDAWTHSLWNRGRSIRWKGCGERGERGWSSSALSTTGLATFTAAAFVEWYRRVGAMKDEGEIDHSVDSRVVDRLSPHFVSSRTSIVPLRGDERIEDLFEFGPILGEGGFSVVYEGRCKRTGKAVAIKVVDKHLSKLGDVKDEIAIMCHTGVHPNIVSLHAAYDTESAYVLVLDLVKGGEVFEHVCRKGSFSEEDAGLLFRAVLQAVMHMHSRHIVHNDIKPENLLLTRSPGEDASSISTFGEDNGDIGLLKVADFGESYFLDDDESGENTLIIVDGEEKSSERPDDTVWKTNGRERKIVRASRNDDDEATMLMQHFRTRRPHFRGGGTPAYMSPERVRHSEYSFSDDIWSMGVCLYIMLCGSHPFDPNGSRTAIGIADEIERGSFDRSNPLWNSLSPSAKDLISRLLARDKDLRITTANELMQHEWILNTYYGLVHESDEAKRLRVARLAGFRVLALLRRSALAIGVSAENMFEAFDTTGDGYISVDELQEKLCSDLGQSFTRDQIEAAIAVLDTDNDNRLSFSEFQLLLQRPLPGNASIRNDHARSLFRAVDRDSSGTIDFEEMTHLAALIGMEGLTVEKLWRSLGKNETESITFEQFRRILKGTSAGG